MQSRSHSNEDDGFQNLRVIIYDLRNLAWVISEKLRTAVMNSRMESFISNSANPSLPVLENFIAEVDLAENAFESTNSSEDDSIYGREDPRSKPEVLVPVRSRCQKSRRPRVVRFTKNQAYNCAYCADVWRAAQKIQRRIERKLGQIDDNRKEYNYWIEGLKPMQQDAILEAGKIHSKRRELLNLHTISMKFERVSALCGVIIIFFIVFVIRFIW